MAMTLLDRETYTDVDAARLLRVPASTLRWWLEGGTRGDRRYLPVLRTEPSGSRMVTWGEFVEARYLREYRRTHNVSLQRLRLVIDRLRAEFGVPYPLAHFRPFVDESRRLVLRLQQEAGLDPDLGLVIEVDRGQIRLTRPAEAFLEVVQFSEVDPLPAERIYPLGKDVPVVFDPTRSFGSPTVKGIRTEALAELVDAGEPIADIAADYGIDEHEVRAAAGFEWTWVRAA